ncbi:dnaJ homolog subfamily C member 9 [Rhynchophorus ferrugineus]|uniref:dnaJ homolog subfamily C member 9 n=1 Tax=Rhynchophorus ferrugineus TaxID=354439 RepID=UPI003FCD3CD2
MATFKEKCISYYGTSNFYEVLGVNRTATDKEIKKAYLKLSLLVHPDRVEPNEKEIATEKFKVLGRIHSILQDNDKRRIYDERGDFDDETDSKCNWREYWFAMFKKIEIKDIQEYEQKYIGSETERSDIKRAYEKSKGSMDRILELVPFTNCDSEPRILDIVREMIDKGEVREFNGFFNESRVKKLRRRRKWEAEEREAAKVNLNELQKEIDDNMEKRGKVFEDMLSNLEAKYAPKKARKSIAGSSAQAKKSRRKNVKRKGRSRISFKLKRTKHQLTFRDSIPFIAALF